MTPQTTAYRAAERHFRPPDSASCGSCHGEALTGNPGADLPPGPNLTSGGALATWTEADFITALCTGRTPDGRELRAESPWRGSAR